MITIYGVYRSRATRNIWLLNEMGVPFRHVPVIQAYRLADPASPDAPIHTRHPDFLKVNPNGHIPSMQDGDVVLHESLAINLYLARKHGGPLAPQTLAEEGFLAMWTLWSVTEVEPHAIQILYHRAMKPEAERDEAIASAAIAALQVPLAILDTALMTGGGYLIGGRFTVADINVAECVRYALAAPETLKAFPHVSGWLRECHARPAYKAMMEKRNAEPM